MYSERDANCSYDPSGIGAATEEILKCAKWLEQLGVESVAMESTGIYWIPVLEILAANGFEVLLVDIRPLARVPGRKTDMVDCQWIQTVRKFGHPSLAQVHAVLACYYANKTEIDPELEAVEREAETLEQQHLRKSLVSCPGTNSAATD